MEASLHVHGMSTHSGHVFYKCRPREEAAVQRGFTQWVFIEEDRSFRRTVRPFVFHSAVTEDSVTNEIADRVGTTSLNVSVGKAVRRDYRI